MIEARRTKALVAAGIERQSGVSNGVQSAQEQRVAVRSRLGRAAAAAMRRLDQVQGEEADRLRACLTMLAAQQSHLDAVRDGFLVLAAVLEHLQGNQQNETFIHRLRLEMNGQRTLLIQLRDACMGHPYPFDHHQKDITIGNYLLTAAPPAEDLGQIMDGSQQILRNLYALHQRALSRLATLADAAST